MLVAENTPRSRPRQGSIAAALEHAVCQTDKAMFEVRTRGRLQRQLIARARGLA